jgi:transposase
VIRLTFGASYHLTQIGRLCKAIRWSLQKPAQQRDEAAIAHWRDET